MSVALHCPVGVCYSSPSFVTPSAAQYCGAGLQTFEIFIKASLKLYLIQHVLLGMWHHCEGHFNACNYSS